LQDLVYREMGIRLTPIKKTMVQNRLGRFVRRSPEISDLSTLIRVVRSNENGAIAQSVYDAIATNHTFFFREINHFKYLSLHLLPELLNESKSKEKNLRIWSAACSTGEEAYSLAITMEEFKKKHNIENLTYEILGSDISHTVLDIAESGIYPAEVIGRFQYHIKKNYFQKGIGSFHNMIRVKKELGSNIRFIRHNLMDSLPTAESFDIVFCRNVMIYFDTESKAKLLENIRKVIKPGGYLFIGHSESLYNSTQDFELVNPTVYRNNLTDK
ncbi:MAG TPA: CheR family methyltransferase, partial [Balneolales bacterium]|nr:CheR family methyltransferase [Balneolales bacterium]